MKYANLAYRCYEKNDLQAKLVLDCLGGILIDSITPKLHDEAYFLWEDWLFDCKMAALDNKIRGL